MPTKKTTKKVPTKTPDRKSDTAALRELRSELYTLTMKHSLRELKEVHKIKIARKKIARFLTKTNNA